MAKHIVSTVEEAEKLAPAVVAAAPKQEKPWPPPVSEWTVDGKSVAHCWQFIGYANTDQGKADPRRAEAEIWFRGVNAGLPKSDNPLDNATSIAGSDFERDLKKWESAKDPKAHDPFSAKLAWLKKKYPAECAGMAAKWFHMPVVESRGGPGVGDEGYAPPEFDGKQVRVGDQILHFKPLAVTEMEEREQRAESIQIDTMVTALNNTAASVGSVAQGATNPMSALVNAGQR